MIRRGQDRWRLVLGLLAVLFGIATLVHGGTVLSGDPAAVAAAGRVVPFVLVFNVCAGGVYVLGGITTVLRHRAALWIAWALAVSTLLVFVALGVHVALGGEFERRTVLAMSLRSTFWVLQALVLPRLIVDHSPSAEP